MRPTTKTISASPNSPKIEAQAAALAPVLSRTGIGILRYGLVIILLWIGGCAFPAHKATSLAPLLFHPPLLDPAYAPLRRPNLSPPIRVGAIALGVVSSVRAS